MTNSIQRVFRSAVTCYLSADERIVLQDLLLEHNCPSLGVLVSKIEAGKLSIVTTPVGLSVGEVKKDVSNEILGLRTHLNDVCIAASTLQDSVIAQKLLLIRSRLNKLYIRMMP